MVGSLMTNISAPCLVFSSLLRITVEPRDLVLMAGLALAVLGLSTVFAGGALKVAGLSGRAFLPPMIFANTGNMGLPLCLLAFGETGLALAVTYFTTVVIIHFTIGVGYVSGAASFTALLRIPVLYAVAAAIAFMVTGTRAPAWLTNTTGLLGDMTIPLMLITLGVSLSLLRVSGMARAFSLSALRLVMGFTVGVGLAWAFDLEGAARGVLILQSSMPVAVFNYLFAQRYARSPEEVAGMVVVSTALSFLSLPFLLWFVL
jgi:predicted permease